jgi:hypothetical protein
MISKQKYESNRTVLFDWLVFAISFSLGFIFPDLEALAFSPWFNWLFAGGLFCYTIGALLKKRPLYIRMYSEHIEPRKIPYLAFLVIGHWILVYVALIFAEPALRKLFGIKMPPKGQLSGVSMTIFFLLACIITWIVFSKKKSKPQLAEKQEASMFSRELIADIFLLTGVSSLTFIFWEKGIMLLLTGKAFSNVSDIWFLFLILSITYLLFYLPLRYLFLLEDHTSRQTWQRMLIIFGLILLRGLFKMMGY